MASLYLAQTIVVYQTLANVDEKQAIRTQQFTALGMLLDHGSDCATKWIANLLYINTFKVSFTPFSMLTAIGLSYLDFYFNVYCQQQTRVFQQGFFSNSCYQVIKILDQHNLNHKYTFNCIQYSFTICGCIVKIKQFCYSLFKKMNCDILKILKNLSLPITLMVTFVSLIYLSPSAIFLNRFHFYVITIGLQQSKIINLWQLAIITKETFSQFPQAGLQFWLNYIKFDFPIYNFKSPLFFDEVQLIFVFSFLSYIHYVIRIVLQLCEVLIVYAFSIKYPQ